MMSSASVAVDLPEMRSGIDILRVEADGFSANKTFVF